MAEDAITYEAVVIGGSAGSLDVILKIILALPAAANAFFIIVTHRKNHPDSLLRSLLSSRTTMVVKEVEDKESIHLNTVYPAPPDYHLLIENEKHFSLDSSEKIHYSRPGIDVTFESVAEIFGIYSIGILLSGANADGAEGLKKIKDAGGYTMVQHPASAAFNYMPQQAILLHAHHAILMADDLPDHLNKLLKKKVL